MFTRDDREMIRTRLLGWARSDDRITRAAVTGSGALGEEDAWSDIDLFFGVTDRVPALDSWTDRMQHTLDALHLFDLRSGRPVPAFGWSLASQWRDPSHRYARRPAYPT